MHVMSSKVLITQVYPCPVTKDLHLNSRQTKVPENLGNSGPRSIVKSKHINSLQLCTTVEFPAFSDGSFPY